MKHLKKLLAAYRITLEQPGGLTAAQVIADSVTTLERDEPENLEGEDRVRRIIRAVALDMEAEDAKAKKGADK